VAEEFPIAFSIVECLLLSPILSLYAGEVAIPANKQKMRYVQY